MADYTVTISDEEEKALLSDMVSISGWIENAIHNKSRQVIDKICLQYSDKQINRLTQEDKLNIIKDITLETAQEPQIKLTAQKPVQKNKIFDGVKNFFSRK